MSGKRKVEPKVADVPAGEVCSMTPWRASFGVRQYAMGVEIRNQTGAAIRLTVDESKSQHLSGPLVIVIEQPGDGEA